MFSWLENIYYEFFRKVYGHIKEFEGNVTTYDYYSAWKLRGDKPDIYCKSSNALKEYLKNIDQPLLQSEFYEVNRRVSHSVLLMQKYANCTFVIIMTNWLGKTVTGKKLLR